MATRQENLPHGIPGVNLTRVRREVPADEPPPLPVNSELGIVGKPVRRIDALQKVTGQARYTYDVKLPGLLYGRILRSPHPNARVRRIDVSAAEAHPQVRAVHIITEFVGQAALRDPQHSNPDIAPVETGRVPPLLYVGADIAAVAATTPEAADEALKLIRVDYEVLPHVCDMEAARAEGAPLVFSGAIEQAGTGGGGGAEQGLPQNGNVRGPSKNGPFGGPTGNVEAGFAASDLVVEGEFRTQVQTHCPLETHGLVADWRPEGLTVYSSTQDVAGVRHDLAEAFKLPRSKVRVITEYVGGGFGAKYGAGNYGRAAVHLSRKAGAPVRMMLDRWEEHHTAGNRPSSWQRLRIGAKRSGELSAIQLLSYGTGGVALGSGVGNIARGMYPCPNFDQDQYDVVTHFGPGCAFRAPGNVQGAFALEQLIDELAERTGTDPIALRDRIDPSIVRREERRRGAAKIGWNRRRVPGATPGPVKRGIGMAQAFWPGIVQTTSSAEVRLISDGSVEVRSSVQDIGTGTRTVLAQIVAEEFGINLEDVNVRVGDSLYPAGPGSGGSKATGSITPAARTAAHRVKQQFLERIASQFEAEPAALRIAKGRVFAASNPSRSMTFKEAAGKMGREQIAVIADREADYGGFFRGGEEGGLTHETLGGVQFAEVTVDTETGQVKVERIVAVHDCGRPINPLLVESQINGGIIQGISYALFEDRVLDNRTGHQLNPNLSEYKFVGAMDVPRIDVELVEIYNARNNTDAFGVAEPANISTAPAVANAVYNAIGVRVRELPMSPRVVLAALAEGRRQA